MSSTQNHAEAVTYWLSTAASQIFVMQLGFLCFESGFVKKVWSGTVILKNMEDTFVGILTYLCFTHTLSTSSPSLCGIISVPNQIFLLNVDPLTYDQVFVSAVFATTCATVISGAVLERMKNKAYMCWCFLILFINYSFVAHWVWNPDGWLAKLGFMDGAGAIVVHSTGGVAGAIVVWRLGPRSGILEKDGTLKPVEAPERPIITAIGAFILWYGWFAFNLSSPVLKDADSAVATTGLVTFISPTCASCSALLLMHLGFSTMSYHNLLGAMLSGLVGITGSCYTVNVWNAALVGALAAPIYFLSGWFCRQKLRLDDPLQIIPVHLCCGLYSCIMEGIVGNDTVGNPGLMYAGYKHFGVQILGAFVCCAFNIVVGFILWFIVMERCIFRNTSIRVSVLDTYLGVSLFELNNSLALNEVLACESNLARQMMFQFHKYTVDCFNDEQLDFLIATQILRDMQKYENENQFETAALIILLIDTYVVLDAAVCVNVSGTQRALLMKVRTQLERDLHEHEPLQAAQPQSNRANTANGATEHKLQLSNEDSSFDDTLRLAERVVDSAFDDVFMMLLPVFHQFLRQFKKEEDIVKMNVGIPFAVRTGLLIEWNKELQAKTHNDKRFSIGNGYKSSRSALLSKRYHDHLVEIGQTSPSKEDLERKSNAISITIDT